MNTNPKREMSGRMISIACMTLKALENELGKNEKNGDATKVITGGEIENINDLTPRIETSAETYTVSLEDSCRKLQDGQKMKIKINGKQREKQLATIREQQEQNNQREDLGR